MESNYGAFCLVHRKPKALPRARADVLGVFLEPDGRLPGFAQRRMDSLIAKKKILGLSEDEERELSEALGYIDTKSMQLLKSGLLPPPGSKRKRQRSAPRKFVHC